MLDINLTTIKELIKLIAHTQTHENDSLTQIKENDKKQHTINRFRTETTF